MAERCIGTDGCTRYCVIARGLRVYPTGSEVCNDGGNKRESLSVESRLLITWCQNRLRLCVRVL
jgi:hypothetical protein